MADKQQAALRHLLLIIIAILVIIVFLLSTILYLVVAQPPTLTSAKEIPATAIPASTATAIVTTSTSVKTVTTTTAVKVRKTPSVDGEVLTVLQPNTSVTTDIEANEKVKASGFCVVKAGEVQGYAACEFLSS